MSRPGDVKLKCRMTLRVGGTASVRRLLYNKLFLTEVICPRNLQNRNVYKYICRLKVGLFLVVVAALCLFLFSCVFCCCCCCYFVVVVLGYISFVLSCVVVVVFCLFICLFCSSGYGLCRCCFVAAITVCVVAVL